MATLKGVKSRTLPRVWGAKILITPRRKGWFAGEAELTHRTG